MILIQTNIRWQFVTYFSATSIKMYAWLWTFRVCRIFRVFYFTFILSFFFFCCHVPAHIFTLLVVFLNSLMNGATGDLFVLYRKLFRFPWAIHHICIAFVHVLVCTHYMYAVEYIRVFYSLIHTAVHMYIYTIIPSIGVYIV